MPSKILDTIKVVSAKLDWLPPFLMRITIGIVFVESGWGKLHDLPKVIEFFRSLGIPAPELQAPFVAGTELVCGSLVLIGLLTRIAAVPLIGTMVVAILTAKLPDMTGWTDIFGYIEYLYIVMLVALIVRGPGAVSADRFVCPLCKS